MAQSSHTRTLVTTTPDTVSAVMPVPRVGVVMGFLGVWMLGWAAGEVTALRALFSGGLNAATLFLVVWVAGWTAAGVLFGFILIVMLDGREIVTVGDGIVRRRVEAFKVGISWRYPLERVSDWRCTGDDDVKSFISFEYVASKGRKTIRFGTGLTEHRAEEITAAVWERFPHLRPRP